MPARNSQKTEKYLLVSHGANMGHSDYSNYSVVTMASITKRGDKQWQAKIRRKGSPGISKTVEGLSLSRVRISSFSSITY